jgi:fumarylpyruvate hydrolase
MSYAFPIWEIPTVPVHNRTERFPVRHIYCVGRNYAEHALEMGGNPDKEPPFFFTKPFDAVVPVVPPAVGDVRYPMGTKDYHHEIELVVAIGTIGVKVSPENAQSLIYGYAVGLDMTRRDLQGVAKKTGRPWDYGKSFAQSAPISEIHRAADVGHLSKGAIWLDVNGKRRQTGDLSELVWDVPHTLSFLSQYYDLMPGDLIYTGTPAGVNAVVPGDTLHGHIDGLSDLRIAISPPV